MKYTLFFFIILLQFVTTTLQANAGFKCDSDPCSYVYTSDEVKAKKELTKSAKNTDQYNLKLTLSNGFVFTYQDGIAKAILKDEELEIRGKYIIPSEIGTFKLSFNPDNGVVWWVFEKPQMK